MYVTAKVVSYKEEIIGNILGNSWVSQREGESDLESEQE